MDTKGKTKKAIEIERRIVKIAQELIKINKVPHTRIRKLIKLFKAVDVEGEDRGLRFGDAILEAQELCPKCRIVLFGKEKVVK